MEILCDNQSVGVVITQPTGEVLLLDRARFPFGLAAPAGHVDEHGSLEQAATTEVFEEVGLIIPIRGLEKVIDARRINNQCRRQNGDYHIWTVYTTSTDATQLRASSDETKGANWYSREQLWQVAENTRQQQIGRYAGNLVFEPIWMDFLTELGYL